MDATQFFFKKAAILVTLALLAVAPWQAQATTTFVVTTSVTVPSPGSQYYLTVAASDGSAVSFTATISYPNEGNHWLSVNGGDCLTPIQATTPATLGLAQACAAGGALGNQAAQIALTATGVTTATVTATPGGAAAGTLTASASSVTLCPVSGGIQYGYLYLSTSGTPITYNISSSLPTWLTVSPATGTVQSGVSTQLTFTATATSLPNGYSNSQPLQFSYSGGTVNISVAINVGGTCSTTGTGTLAISPSVVNWSYSTVNPVTQSAAVAVTLSTGAASYYASVNSIAGGWLSLYTTSNTTPGTSTIGSPGSVLYLETNANAQSLLMNSYPATVQVTDSNGNYGVITVNLAVNGATTVGGVGSSVAPASLQFNYETGVSQTLQPQSIMIGGSSTFTISTSVGASTNWLSTNLGAGTGTAPAMISVIATPGNLGSAAYPGTVTVHFGDGTTQSVTVNLNVVASTPLVYANPGTVIFNQPGATTPSSNVILYTTDNSTIPVTVSTSTSWLSFISALPTTTQSSFAVQANTAGLPAGLTSGSITVTYGTSTLTIPVVVYLPASTVSGSGYLTFSPSSVSLAAAVGSAAAQSTTLYVTSSTTNYFTAAVSQGTCAGTWLSIGTTSGYAYLGYNQPITVSASVGSLAAQNCTGAVLFTSGGLTQSVPVTFGITGGSLTPSPATLIFSYSGTVPAAQSVTLTNTSAASIGYTAAATSTGNWLAVSPTSGSVLNGSPGSLSVSLNAANLAALTAAGSPYSGTVTVTPTGGAAQTVTVTLNVTATPISATPSSLTFTYQAGAATPAAQTISVTGGSFSAVATSTGNWLAVTPASGTAATTLSVSVSPSSLSAGMSYTGAITVTGTNGTTGTATTTVTLTVTAPLPTITAVQNSASGATGAVSPGEVIAIGGAGLGPVTPATLTLTSSGNVSTSIGGVTVTIGGTLAPLVYVSSSQINAIVPYEVSGLIAPTIVVSYLGQSSNGYPLQTAVAAPAIYTQNQSGSGPGAILNQDYTLNGSSHPAAKGSIVQVFMTGEGTTSPTHVTGKVNNVTSASQLPVPLLPVSALVGGQPALVTFVAEAPGLVSGVMQVNIQIPATLVTNGQPTAESIVISVGTSATPNGVTVTVQ